MREREDGPPELRRITRWQAAELALGGRRQDDPVPSVAQRVVGAVGRLRLRGQRPEEGFGRLAAVAPVFGQRLVGRLAILPVLGRLEPGRQRLVDDVAHASIRPRRLHLDRAIDVPIEIDRDLHVAQHTSMLGCWTPRSCRERLTHRHESPSVIGMTKRLQVLMDDDELRSIQRLARKERMTTAEWVRQRLREAREDRTELTSRPSSRPSARRANTGSPCPTSTRCSRRSSAATSTTPRSGDLRRLEYPDVPGRVRRRPSWARATRPRGGDDRR